MVCEPCEGRAGLWPVGVVPPAASMLPGTPQMFDGYLVKEQMVQEQNRNKSRDTCLFSASAGFNHIAAARTLQLLATANIWI